MNELVFKGQDGQALTSSLLVAEKFGKEHKHVLDSIRALLAENSAETVNQQVSRMFLLTEYESPLNNGTDAVRKLPMYIMNRDGFTLLTMGFTGKKAFKFKLDYIAAFNEMERKLKEQRKPLSGAEYLLQQAQLMVEQERRLKNVENRLDAIEQERDENGRLLLEVSVSNEKVPEISLRDKIRQLVNQYSSASNIRQQDVWHKIYSQLYYLYHISIKNYRKIRRNESKLEIAERNHFLDKIYNIISNMIREYKAA